MKQKNRQQFSTATRVISAILIVILLLGVVVFFATFTNGFTSDFKTFYVKCDNVKIQNDKTNFDILMNKAYRFDVCYTFGFLNKEEQPGYHVRVVPNVSGDNDFDFIIDGQKYLYSAETDLTDCFEIERDKSFFTLTADKNLLEVLQVHYSNKTIENVPDIVNSEIDYFALIIETEDKTVQIKISFCLRNFVIVLDHGEVIF